jgi:hypothetical protein
MLLQSMNHPKRDRSPRTTELMARWSNSSSGSSSGSSYEELFRSVYPTPTFKLLFMILAGFCIVTDLMLKIIKLIKLANCSF